jgi:mannose-6-phosphate isomerase-like protein (cupin superfamily)
MKSPYVKNIDKDTLNNEDYRKVVWTGDHLQLVLMNILPGQEIGEETHTGHDQFIRLENGSGVAIINDQEYEIGEDFGIVIPSGSKHNIINTGFEPMKLYSIYAPAEHPDGAAQPVKESFEKIVSFNQFINENKPADAPDWHDSDAPDAEGRFKDLSPKDLAAWLIKTRKKDLKKITGSLNQQIVFNRKSDPKYADKMEKTRREVYKQLGREDLL